MGVDHDLIDSVTSEVSDRLLELDTAADVKEALVAIGRAQISVLHGIFLEVAYRRDYGNLVSAVERIERAIERMADDIQRIEESIDAKGT